MTPPTLHTDHASFSAAGMSPVQDVTLQVEAGEMVVVTGPEGSGKSTLLRGVLGLATLTGGALRVFDVDARDLSHDVWMALRRRCAYASWTAPLLSNLTIYDNLAVPLFMRSISQSNARADVERVLDRLGLSALAERRVPDVRSDEHRLALLARALIIPAELLVVDDPPAGAAVDAALRDAVELGQAVLVTTRNGARFPAARQVRLSPTAGSAAATSTDRAAPSSPSSPSSPSAHVDASGVAVR